MIIVLIMKAVVEYLRGIFILKITVVLDKSILSGLYKHVVKLPLKFFSTRKTGEITARFNDAIRIRQAIASIGLTAILDLVMIVVSSIMLIYIDSRLFIISLISLVLYVLNMFIFKDKIEEHNENVMEQNSQVNSYLIESLEGIETVKALNGENEAIEITNRKIEKSVQAAKKYGYITNNQSLHRNLIKNIFSIFVIWVGVNFVFKDSFTIGTLLTFNAILVYFTDPMERLVNLQGELQGAIVAAKRAMELLEISIEKENEENRIELTDFKKQIEFKNVNFSYSYRSKVLKNINFTVNRGERVAIVGESGSGKTTIAKLLMNFYDVNSGEIMIDRKNINDIKKDDIRNIVSYISQDNFFFLGTIIENLTFGNKDITIEEIKEICKQVKLDKVIESMPFKYNTILEENAANLSSGQKQRLAIARSLLRKPKVVILDEATSNLDSITEMAIEESLNTNYRKITQIVIAHRLNTIINSDKIIVLNKGEIEEIGSHEELMKNKGVYYNLWRENISNKYKYK